MYFKNIAHYDFTPETIAHLRVWITALRSGEFQQTRSYLEMDGQYCCLGVACKVALTDPTVPLQYGHVPVARLTPVSSERICGVFNGEKSYLPVEVAKWLGFTHDRDPEIVFTVADIPNLPIKMRDRGELAPGMTPDNSIGAVSFTVLNDDMQLSFVDIADILDACLTAHLSTL